MLRKYRAIPSQFAALSNAGSRRAVRLCEQTRFLAILKRSVDRARLFNDNDND
jgi:hypothetical protein